VDIRCFPVLEFYGVHEAVLGVAGDCAGIVKLDIHDSPGLAVVLVVGAALLIQDQFDPISDLECLFRDLNSPSINLVLPLDSF